MDFLMNLVGTVKICVKQLKSYFIYASMDRFSYHALIVPLCITHMPGKFHVDDVGRMAFQT